MCVLNLAYVAFHFQFPPAAGFINSYGTSHTLRLLILIATHTRNRPNFHCSMLLDMEWPNQGCAVNVTLLLGEEFAL